MSHINCFYFLFLFSVRISGKTVIGPNNFIQQNTIDKWGKNIVFGLKMCVYLKNRGGSLTCFLCVLPYLSSFAVHSVGILYSNIVRFKCNKQKVWWIIICPIFLMQKEKKKCLLFLQLDATAIHDFSNKNLINNFVFDKKCLVLFCWVNT